jgi:hypothetical protein
MVSGNDTRTRLTVEAAAWSQAAMMTRPVASSTVRCSGGRAVVVMETLRLV